MMAKPKRRHSDTASTTTTPNDSPSKMHDADKGKKAEEHRIILEQEAAYEDPYGDEFEEEEFIFNNNSDNEEKDDGMEDEDPSEGPVRPWRPGVDPIENDEELEYDPNAYDMYHRATLDWSCLSFDIMPDQLGYGRETFPHTVYVVAGTQADKCEGNRLFVSKWINLTKTKHHKDEESEDDDEDDDELEETDGDPILEFKSLEHEGTVNRTRCCPQMPRLVATWSDTKKIYMWDIKEQLDRLDVPGSESSSKQDPKFTYSGHKDEGFAMAFNPLKTGVFASGSCDSTICIWNPVEGGWSVEKPIRSHTSSVEDIQWKKLGNGFGDVFASCSVDRSIHLFDLRISKPKLVIPEAHTADVNVVSWSPFQEDFLLSGGDEGCTRVWDMRNTDEPVVHLHYHREAVSSIDWHPTDPAMFAVASLDNSVTLWDMSVEPDQSSGSPIVTNSPDQLMFQHMGQTHISEIQWHPQIPGNSM